MIQLKKRPSIPKSLESNNAKNEIKKAHKFLSAQTTLTKKEKEEKAKFKFKEYRKKDVKKALESMCFAKCVYCESVYKHVYYGDIEHYRPKKEISGMKPGEKSLKPGYYWLANEWDNLFLSCLFCNQAKKQIIKNDDGKFEEITLGKQNKFPLSNHTFFKKTRSQNWDMKKDDKYRLLINPESEDPEEHFAYNEFGVILPLSKKAEISITTFGLQRHYLVQERFKLYKIMSAAMFSVLDTFTTIHKNQDNELVNKFYIKKYRRELDGLMNFIRLNMPYSGMARFFIKDFLKNKIKYSDQTITSLFNAYKDSPALFRDNLPGQLGMGTPTVSVDGS